MPLTVIVIYLLACILCGVMGRNTTIGFMGHFLLALILTPLLNFLIQAVGRQSSRVRDHLRAPTER
ncbi:hypothetical protein [Nitrospirillum sp. BR 11163]|uniref:hypothetical protein n=1 Tax=Nitrospirillum sp. BR 11163 TaxID=3104323 RepID=UPI002AFEB7F4|nr:hypothetical protein [Nitrospirillum sp. BR 11163]MEA1673604.1 hypothetical protein [Nitrospirillum sp. BR 11163]